MAVRDVAPIERSKWISPVYWRDRLPRELAIQMRLNEQLAHKQNIHRYIAHRLDMKQRRYRVYNEVCEFGDMRAALEFYSAGWRRRRNMFRWLEAHPHIAEMRTKATNMARPGGWDGAKSKNEITRVRERALDEYRRARTARGIKVPLGRPSGETEADERTRQLRTGAEFDVMSDLYNSDDDSGWAGEELQETLPPVIPEAFLWHVLRQLINAFTMLHAGNGIEVVGKPWREIIHGDVHLGNVFLKPTSDAIGTLLSNPSFENDFEERSFMSSQYPTLVLADFDRAFFALASSPYDYQDNPNHYLLGTRPTLWPDQGGRYPPELFRDYVGHLIEPEEPLTSQTDVFGIGQIMWNLIMNLPGKRGFKQSPFFDNAGTTGRLLVNGEPYTQADVKANLFSGQTPFEASGQYSKQLKNVVRFCLKYRQSSRPTLATLRTLVEELGNKYESGKGMEEDGDVRLAVEKEVLGLRIGEKFRGRRRGRGDESSDERDED